MPTLRNDFMRDLISDIRFCDRKIEKGINVIEETNYKNKLVLDLKALLKNRHGFAFNNYGYPLEANH